MHLKLFSYPVLSVSLLVSLFAKAQVISPQGREVEISYTASFIMLSESDDFAEAAKRHSDHLMGVFQSQTLSRRLVADFDESEGIGAPRMNASFSAFKTRELNDGRLELSYNYRAKALLHRRVASRILQAQKGLFEVVLPYDFKNLYLRKCTDPNDPSPEYFWYYWDPYRKGCDRLLEEPRVKRVEIKVKALDYQNLETQTRFDLLRGANDNGKLFRIDIINGFIGEGGVRDEGRTVFERLNTALEKKFKFELKKREGSPSRPLYTYSKSLSDGGEVVIRHLLTDSDDQTRKKDFARFLKNSVKEADVIIYSGHSGLGSYLDIPALEAEVGAFEFNPKKRQLFYLNSCASYSYYLEHFKSEKTKARIDVLTNALAAYIDEDSQDVQVLLEELLSNRSPTWLQLLEKMEKATPDDLSYLLSVGGV